MAPRGAWLVLAAALLVIGFSSSASASTDPASSYISCLNDQGTPAQTTYEDFVEGKPTRLLLRKAWWSEKAPRLQLTVVTGLTSSRLDQLEAQCASWKGPLSAAVYIVVRGDGAGGMGEEARGQLEKAEADAAEFHKKMEVADGCQLDMSLLYEVVADDVMTMLLPINVMRNYALVQARTRLVAMVDVDLLLSATLSTWMESKDNVDYLQRECAAKRVFVMPAFETPHNADQAVAHKFAGDAVAIDKKGLEEMVGKRLVHQFALYLFREGHNMTEYNKWFAADKPYQVGWTKDYEPWFITDRFLNPFYDSVFRGYGWNKVTHVNNVNGQGFTFMVHPSAWIVHRQHGRSGADKMYQSQKKAYEAEAKADPKKAEENTSLAGMTHRFRNKILAALAEGSYAPSVDDGVKGCVASLPWWQREDKGAAPFMEDESYDGARRRGRRLMLRGHGGGGGGGGGVA
ncbi:hypothetical protein Rsub_02099 [Raphidocelis subcapitata]|uniref:Uncharacterized protein n=1 Tax=Raphidocelis subcapitata TaxID=307507 RepID=A0A2V0NRF2_9CHLO|nr:hypothetical protein Rsub_02099 [Raphidocelis subcapitata]|eukprot:GBF89222.1 hypothetical protein Rsub_02099 [Raphidocelis subcapitata]